MLYAVLYYALPTPCDENRLLFLLGRVLVAVVGVRADLDNVTLAIV